MAIAGLNGVWIALLTTSWELTAAVMTLSKLAFAEAPRIDIIATRVRPIISALAVAAVRRGLRSEFSRASTPTVPKNLR